MSLILDALRKSEAERRRGQAPDLFASVAAPPPSRAGELLRFWPGFVFVALVLAAGWVFWRGEETATTATDPTPVDAPDARMEPADSSNTQPMPPASSPPPSFKPAQAQVAASPAAPATRAPATNGTAAPPIESQLPPARPAAAELPAPPATTTVAETATPPRTDDSEFEPLPPIAVLSASERATLPPLKLSMHVFGSEPGKRFAIIDGQRVTEGSVLGGSSIEAIRRDGVVLNVNGRRILLPRP